MIVDQAGTYRLLEDFTIRGTDSIETMQKGSLLIVSQVDLKYHKVIGPAFPDWCFWELPVEIIVDEKPVKETKVRAAMDLIYKYGGIGGEHHKQWLLDQLVRKLSDDYDSWIRYHNDGEDGPNTYEWDTGIAP